MSIRKCFVQCCANNSSTTPNKVFFMVSDSYARRKLWFKAIGRDINKSRSFCCGDPFELKNDTTNFVQFQLTGGKLHLKLDVIPHKHLIQPHISPAKTPVKRRAQLEDFSGIKKKVTVAPSSNEPISPKSSGITSPSGLMVSFTSECSKACASISTSSVSSIDSHNSLELKRLSQKRTLLVIEKESRFYLGLPTEVYYITKLLCGISKLRHMDILLTLKKIRLNDPYLRLGMDFGIDRSYAGKIFNKTIKIVGLKFSQLIFWPSVELNKKFMPIPFRKKYSNVQSIIDCFEILIEKPSNPKHQALTWSAYKHGNTLKYLISCTPYGCVNFVSCGYGGRASDVTILQDCDYLEKLPNNCSVMADRGFKNVSQVLQEKNCVLVRPPSVSAEEKLTKEAVHEGRSIAALRIHIERVIGRLREFNMLSPHACIDIHLLGCMDAVVLTACGLINLQPALIKF